MRASPGKKLRDALAVEKPLQVVGTVNAYTALLARDAGFQALYLSGAGVANASYGLPDLGITTLDNVLEDASRILAAVDLPLLVDIDTGWGNSLTIERAIQKLCCAGAAGVHIEDQVFEKKCGHLPGKTLVPTKEMQARLAAAVAAKEDPHLVVMARTDAFSSEGLDGVITRAKAYRDAGADMLFPEAIPELENYQAIKDAVDIPILANMTEFGKTPLYTVEQLRSAGVDIVLYPLSAFRAMSQAALTVFTTIRREGTQKTCVGMMQTRQELYRTLHYDAYEKKLTVTKGS